MFFPFIGAASVAIAFSQLGAMTTKVAVLTGSLYAVVAIAILIGLYALSLQYRS